MTPLPASAFGRRRGDGDAHGPAGRRRVVSVLPWQLGRHVSVERGLPVSPAQPDVRPARLDGRPEPLVWDRRCRQTASAADDAGDAAMGLLGDGADDDDDMDMVGTSASSRVAPMDNCELLILAGAHQIALSYRLDGRRIFAEVACATCAADA